MIACTFNTHAIVSCANACRLLEGTAVQRDTHVDLVRGGAVGDVPFDSLVGGNVRAHTAVQVGWWLSVMSCSVCQPP